MRWTGVVLLVLASLGVAAAAEKDSGKKAEIEPAKKADADRRIQQLIGQLGHADYAVRQKAQAELEALGPEALEALEAAEGDEDLEIASRARYLVRSIQWEWLAKLDSQDTADPLRGYPRLDAAARLSRIRLLGDLRGGKGVAALGRLVRFEPSERLSKYAAVEILQQVPPGEPPGAELAAVVREGLGSSARPAARWLQTWIRFAGKPDEAAEALEQWARLVEEEQALLKQSPGKTAPTIFTSLLRFQVARLEKAKRIDEAVSALRKLIEVETGDPLSLLRLADLLAKQKAWSLIEEMESRFPGPVATVPLLIYCVAHARAQQGKVQEAEATAARARGLYQGNSEEALYRHAKVARDLVERGMFAWAEQECRHVIATADRQNLYGLSARYTLASMFHDLDKDLKAADVEKEMVEILKEAKPGKSDLPLENLATTTGQMHYYYACHWLAQGNREKHRKHLDDALAADPHNVDALIAAYRLADAPPEYRRKTLQGIKSCVAEMRRDIAARPGQALHYNNLAWLVANTEGDLDEALKCSRKSLELEPNNGGYYDTLGRVYYARGDHPSAVLYQRKAAELIPHSRQIARQLKLFEEALAAAKEPSQ